MEAMKEFPDKYFDLVVADPPYGLQDSVVNSGGRFKRYHNPNGNWDMSIPTQKYFDELFRVSKEQVIWGGNYFGLPANRCFLIWDKGQPEGISFAMCEYAWCSMDSVAQIYKKRTQGQEARFHPTQKPIHLYEWIFMRYLPDGGKVLDTHLGSGSSRIAANKRGNIDFYGYEIDDEYYYLQEERFKLYLSQEVLDFNGIQETNQEARCVSEQNSFFGITE